MGGNTLVAATSFAEMGWITIGIGVMGMYSDQTTTGPGHLGDEPSDPVRPSWAEFNAKHTPTTLC